MFQDIKLIHRNPLYYYTLKMRKQKEKLGKQSNSLLKQQKQKDKILRNAFTQINKRPIYKKL